jgi:selenocysteine lyase/cysteine desulfurase
MSVSVLPRSLHLFTPALDVVGQDLDVPVQPSGSRRFVNLDLAATAPCSTAVWQALTEALPWYGSVHRGAGLPSEITSERFEHSRGVVRSFVGGRPDDAVVFTANTTAALNLLAHCLPPATTVIAFSSEHHANLLPWPEQRTIRLPVPNSPDDALRLVADALAATSGEGLVCVTGASNVTGEVWPLEELADLAHAAGARIAVDGAQLVPHREISIATTGIDYIAFSGHKLYAPLGGGALVGQADWLQGATPYSRGGGATASVTQDEVIWKDDAAARHEAGTPNALGAIALAAACLALTATGLHRLAARDSALRSRLERGLATISGLRVVELWPEHHDRVGVLAFTLEGWEGSRLAAVLSAEHATGVRAGRFCAHLLVEHLLRTCDDSDLPADDRLLRVSWGASTQPADIDRLVRALSLITTRGPQCDYVRTADGWRPQPDTRPACW